MAKYDAPHELSDEELKDLSMVSDSLGAGAGAGGDGSGKEGAPEGGRRHWSGPKEESPEDLKDLRETDFSAEEKEPEDDLTDDEVSLHHFGVMFSPLFWGLLLVIAFAIYQAYYFVLDVFLHSEAAGWAVLTVLIMFTLLTLVYVIREVYASVRLRTGEGYRKRSEEIRLGGGGAPEALRFCRELVRSGAGSKRRMPQFERRIGDSMSAGEVLDCYSSEVLSAADRKAEKIIRRAGAGMIVYVSLSPMALTDLLIILLRNLYLMDQVASCYGIRLGVASRIMLYKRIITHLVVIGAADMALDLGVDVAGGWMIAKVLGGRFGKGVTSGVLTSRLGMETMRLCRPLEFTVKERESLAHVRRDLLTEAGNTLTGILRKNGMKAEDLRAKDAEKASAGRGADPAGRDAEP